MKTISSLRSSVLCSSEMGAMNQWNGGAWFFAVLLCVVSLSGCSATYEATKTPRTPTEQLLLTQSLQRTLIEAEVPFSAGQTVAVETVGLTADQAFVTAFIEKQTGRLIRSTPIFEGDAYFNKYTVFVFVNFSDTDLLPPPP